MELREYAELQKDELLETLQTLIQIPSVRGETEADAPYGRKVRECLDAALETAERLGFKSCNMDNQVGYCEYGEGEEMVAVLAHLDVVPEGDGWTVEPYGGIIADGRIYGRGSMDDKGPCTAALYGLKAVREYIEREGKAPLKRRIRLIFGTNEETGSADMSYYRAHGGELPVCGFTPDAEYPVINGEKGIINEDYVLSYGQSGPVQLLSLRSGGAPNIVPAQTVAELSCPAETAEQICKMQAEKIRTERTERGVRITAEGLSAHGAFPQDGENAIGRLMIFLKKLPLSTEKLAEGIRFVAEKLGMETDGTALGIAMTDEPSGALTLNLGVAEGDAHALTLRLNYRYPVTKCYEDCEPKLREAFETVGFTMKNQLHKASLYVAADQEPVKTLLSVYTEMTGLPGEAKSIGGGTYAKCIPNTVAFGPIFPGDVVREHKPDEYMEIERLVQNTQIYAEAMYRLAK